MRPEGYEHQTNCFCMRLPSQLSSFKNDDAGFALHTKQYKVHNLSQRSLSDMRVRFVMGPLFLSALIAAVRTAIAIDVFSYLEPEFPDRTDW